jgi:hypothetical protein
MDRRTQGFVLVTVVLTLLAAMPGPFDWANRIEPTLFEMPFSMVWQFLIAALFCLTLVAWYFTDASAGDLDIDTEVIEGRDLGSVDLNSRNGSDEQATA